jgi:hypothetical protein
MDSSLLLTEFTNNFEIQTTYKTVVYSIKLKLEFYVLNQLLFIIQNPNCSCSNSHNLFEYDAGMADGRVLPSRSALTSLPQQKNDPAASIQVNLEESIRSMSKGETSV